MITSVSTGPATARAKQNLTARPGDGFGQTKRGTRSVHTGVPRQAGSLLHPSPQRCTSKPLTHRAPSFAPSNFFLLSFIVWCKSKILRHWADELGRNRNSECTFMDTTTPAASRGSLGSNSTCLWQVCGLHTSYKAWLPPPLWAQGLSGLNMRAASTQPHGSCSYTARCPTDTHRSVQNVCCRSDLTSWERGCMLCANGTPPPGNPSQRRNKCGSMEALYIYILLHSLLLTWKYTEFFSNCNCTQIKLQNFFFFLTFFPLLCVLISSAFSFFSSFCFFLQSHWR